MAHALFGPEVRLMLAEANTEGMKAFVESLHPSTIAETLTEDTFTVDQVWQVLSHASSAAQAAVFEYFTRDHQVRMAEGAGRAQMAKLIEVMSHDDRVDLLRRLDKRVSEALLRLVDEADRRDIANLVQYPENTVGSIMTTDYAWLPPELTAGEAIDRLRLQAPDRETIYYIYIVDERSRRLLGILGLRALVLADRTAAVRDLMSADDLVSLRVTDDREKAGESLARYDLIAVPVLDEQHRLVGIVTHDDAIDVIQQAATEDMQRQAGVGPILEGYLNAPLWKIWKSRAGWLALLFVMQMLTITTMERYEDSMKALIILTFFIPVCTSVGGNAGSQAATLVTRAMALNEVKVGQWRRVLGREVIVGLSLGAIVGLLGFVRTWIFTSSESAGSVSVQMLAVVIGLSVTLICVWGTLIGSLLPLVFRKLGFDPATASSPFIATLSDVTGIIIYFNVAWLLLLRG